MEARDNSFDLDIIHKPNTIPRQQHSQPIHDTHPHTRSTHSFLPRQQHARDQWLSSSSFSLSQTPQRPREHFPLRHQPLSYPQARPHSSSRTSTSTSSAFQLYPRYAYQSTSFANPPSSINRFKDRSISSGSNSKTLDYDWSSSSSFTKIDAITHAIRNKIIVEEDEEDILSMDRFY
ncbi:uncharacterized protein LOC117779896 [Drosophila innubila]|uniref:uncharacterized protein LOC117779896 n=1 Tax=Drosophila innubila TaxID=198719 RepID=UPI00148BFE96|nr:uncharacterized protein LOC117779896 [Drosophila innubila]